jgi:mono/diheme cytochrome c family protein
MTPPYRVPLARIEARCMALFVRSVLAFALSLTMIAAITAPAGAQSLVEKGDTLYHNRCAGCHGEQLKAFAGGPAFDLRRLRPDEHDRFVESVISGKDNMPSWYGILKADEIEAIWAYIRAIVDR